jgi:hypothetical protein
MDTSDTLPPSGYSPRFRLSARGHTTEAAYRDSVTRMPGRIRPRLDVPASARWANEHGLDPDDGPYLVELASRPLTLGQLGEALAIHSQSQEMIALAVDRLLCRGLVCVV